MAAMRTACSESAPLRQPADQWPGFDRKVLMPIRITCRAKWRDRREVVEKQGLDALWAAYPKASYTDKNENPRVLCGSI